MDFDFSRADKREHLKEGAQENFLSQEPADQGVAGKKRSDNDKWKNKAPRNQPWLAARLATSATRTKHGSS